MKRTSTFLIGIVILVTAMLAGPAAATLNFVAGPEDAWAYSILRPAGNSSPSFFATETSQFAGAVFQGFVVPDVSTFSFDPDGTASDTFHVFTTFLLSVQPLEVDLFLSGDDGLSVFLDGVFVGGAPFGIRVGVTANIPAGEVSKIELVGHNAFGPTGFQFCNECGLTFEALFPGVLVNADAALIPEPSTALLICLGLVGLAAWRET